MAVDFSAFTIKSKSLLAQLVTPTRVRQGTKIATILKLSQNDIQVLAIQDTGATTTSISKRLSGQLKLKPISKTTVHGVNSSHEVNVYVIDILLPNKIQIPDVHVTEASNLGEYDVLIGMDLITLTQLRQ